VDAPIPTQTSHAGHICIAEPFVMAPGSTGAPRETGEPLPTITTGGAGVDERPGCARPMLIEPFILSQASGGAPRSIGEPIPTATTGGNGASHALISPYYGTGSGETCESAENPLPTITSKARFGMVVPVTNGSGGPGPRNVEEPLPTMTTAKGGEFAVVMPVTHHDASDRVRSADEPLPTLTGANRGELAFITAQSGEIDILFRMLEPHELASAMGFDGDDQAYEFAGTKTEKIKQIGNAVSVAKMKACVSAIMADAVAKPTAEPVAAARKARA
jgi:DNA (cytosine-5)-methyltransferase 1